MTRSQIRKYAFIKSIPIMCSYIFVSMAYGIMMEDAGFKWYYSLLVSLTVYTGAFQFVLITFLSIYKYLHFHNFFFCLSSSF